MPRELLGALCSVWGNGILSPAFASYRRAGKISGAGRDRTGGRCSGGKDSQGGGAPDPGGHGHRRQRPELPGERGGPSSGRDRRPLRAGASITEGRRGPYLQTRPRRSVPASWRRSCRRFRVVFLVNSGASWFSASKIPFGKMDISGRFSGKTQNVILILDQNYRKHIPGSYRDRESVETGRFPGAGLQEK